MKTILDYINENKYPILKQYELLDLFNDELNEGFIDSVKDKLGSLKGKVEKALAEIKKQFNETVLQNVINMIKAAASKSKKYLFGLLQIVLLIGGTGILQSYITPNARREFQHDFIIATYADAENEHDWKESVKFANDVYKNLSSEQHVWSWTGSGVGKSKEEARKNAEQNAIKKWKLNDGTIENAVLKISYIDHYDSNNGYGCVAILKTASQNF